MEELSRLLEEGIVFLKQHNVKWNKVLLKMKDELDETYTKEGILSFLLKNEWSIYGGMGSLYDIIICPENGHIADDFQEANKKLDDYRERLSKEWQRLKKESRELEP